MDSSGTSHSKTEYILEELDEVKDIMHENFVKLTHHVVQLEELDSKTQEIKEMSETMKARSTKLKIKEWWKNSKIQIMITCLVLFVILLIILFVIFTNHT